MYCKCYYIFTSTMFIKLASNHTLHYIYNIYMIYTYIYIYIYIYIYMLYQLMNDIAGDLCE